MCVCVCVCVCKSHALQLQAKGHTSEGTNKSSVTDARPTSSALVLRGSGKCYVSSVCRSSQTATINVLMMHAPWGGAPHSCPACAASTERHEMLSLTCLSPLSPVCLACSKTQFKNTACLLRCTHLASQILHRWHWHCCLHCCGRSSGGLRWGGP